MDLDDFRLVLDTAGVDVWDFIDAAISVASSDFGSELKHRRDGIVERLYAPASAARCVNCHVPSPDGGVKLRSESSPEERKEPLTPLSEELDPYGGLLDDEQTRILQIKEQLEEPDQSEDDLVDLLQSLSNMDITFRALKETDIGRHVNRLRKHSSSDVRGLVKHLVRKWKEIVDEWVKFNQPGEQATSSALMADGDSPLQKIPQSYHHQVPDFAYSPNPNNGSYGSDRNNSEPEPKPKSVPRKEAPPRPAAQSVPASQNRPRDAAIDMERLASARKRLQANYKEAENGLTTFQLFSVLNTRLTIIPHPRLTLIGFACLVCVPSEAKRQRTIQVMDIHEIPKPKNTFFAKNKGGGSHGKRW